MTNEAPLSSAGASSPTMAAPCLKVELDGTEVLPKRFSSVKWGKEVQDNEERDRLREADVLAGKMARASMNVDEDEDEYEEVVDDAEDEEEEEEDGLSQDIIMGYLKVLSQYGYADTYKLQSLSSAAWDDLARNVGIEPEHEKHLMAALGMKRKVLVRAGVGSRSLARSLTHLTRLPKTPLPASSECP